MSQEKKPKEKIEVKPHNAIVIDLPMVRNFSTGGGHGPEDTLGRRRREDRDEEVAGISATESEHRRKADAGNARGVDTEVPRARPRTRRG